jgi:hypothetical protein
LNDWITFRGGSIYKGRLQTISSCNLIVGRKDCVSVVIYVFESAGREGLRAFAGDRTGSSLPVRHGPWKQLANISRREGLPHALDRKAVEEAIAEHGFQLWRVKKASSPAA